MLEAITMNLNDIPIGPIAPPFRFIDDEPVNFIDSHIVQTNSKFETFAVTYDTSLKAYVAGSSADVESYSDISSAQTKAREQRFQNAVTSYLRSRKGSKIKFDPRKATSWDDVLGVVAEAQNSYQEKGANNKGMLSSMRDRLRRFDTGARRCDQWMKLLPSESWQGSLICGGIKIVLQAAIQIGKMRADLCDAIEQIPEMITTTQKLEDLNSQVSAVRGLAFNIYVTILDLLEISLSWFEQSPWQKLGNAVLKGGDYDLKLSGAIHALKSLETRLDRQALLQTQVEQRKSNREQRQFRSEYKQDTQRIMVALNPLNEFMALFRDQKADNNKNRAIEELRNSELRSLNEKLDRMELLANNERRAKNQERKASLLDRLRFDKMLPLRALQASLSFDASTLEAAQDRIAYLLQAREYTSWLSMPTSGTLVLNGSEPEHNIESATSLFTAMFLRILSRSFGGRIIYWFCAQQDPWSSVQEMLRSMIGQVIAQASDDIDVPDPRACGRLDHVGSLAQLLVACIQRQLRHSAVCCVIDSISSYEDHCRGEDICYVFKQLTAITRCEGQYQFKLLVTSPTRASDISEVGLAVGATVFDADDEVDSSWMRLMSRRRRMHI